MPLVCRSLYFQGLWSNWKLCKRQVKKLQHFKSPEQIVGIVKKSACTAVVHWRRIAELLGKSKNLATHGGNVSGLMFQLTVLYGFKIEVVQ